ncbi:hypothetical protein FHX82_007201 [Amycolatopsis bartoniae]|uniref:CHAP domain-containing protein n=1 Tax=Amycolatopsis bartoniae TaxID=941986 RepID=A0A8H9IVP1_9PSEU|nr:hypothetical protein [Amycolatopsis bartoniae]MBB2940115.1 hypothetical protein [Amycolatopsis bartoniae]TVT07706.1 hypothetical protein FNH07_15280 [Amycolatopsis bartoniae]GHF54072.1 hypothetical protein GCM10017566_29440 [Amycolatopsis bartoniae]
MRLTKLSKTVAALALAAAATAGAGFGTATAAPVPADLVSTITAADIADPTAVLPDETGTVTAAQTVEGAITWYKSRNGSTAYEGYCEKAARLAWDRTTHHASAIEHWQSSDGARHTTGTPPRGAFVFWNISAYGHVGIADGNGGVWATSVNGAIGHVKQGYFANYLGWKPGNSN